MITVLVYVVLALVVIYIAMILWKVISFIAIVAAGVFCLYLIARIISHVSEWVTKQAFQKRKNASKKNDTPRYLIDKWNKNNEEITAEENRDNQKEQLRPEKIKQKMSDEEAMKYARYCTFYLEHEEEMKQYETKEDEVKNEEKETVSFSEIKDFAEQCNAYVVRESRKSEKGENNV